MLRIHVLPRVLKHALRGSRNAELRPFTCSGRKPLRTSFQRSTHENGKRSVDKLTLQRFRRPVLVHARHCGQRLQKDTSSMSHPTRQITNFGQEPCQKGWKTRFGVVVLGTLLRLSICKRLRSSDTVRLALSE